jgi:hypothetical protein
MTEPRGIESAGLIEGEASHVLHVTRQRRTDEMEASARAKGWAPALPDREFSRRNVCSGCGEDGPVLVSGGAGRLLCDRCFDEA